MGKQQDTGWDYVTEDIEANPQGPPQPTPDGPRPSQLIDQQIADDGTIFGEDEFHVPSYRPADGTEDLWAEVGMALAVSGRTWRVIEDPAALAGRRWAEQEGR